MRRAIGFGRWLLTAAVLLGCSLGTDAAASRPDPGPSAAPADTPLPDSVLAVIGRHRVVTVSQLTTLLSSASPSPDSLTPQGARGFLERLIDREVLTHAALAETGAWAPEDSARLEVLRDHLVVAAALDSALAALRVEGARWVDSDPAETERLGTALRDSSMRRLAPSFDQPLLERLAEAWRALPRPSSDSSLTAQLRMLQTQPRVAPADSSAVIARSSLGEYRVADLLQSWERLSPAYRPRVDSAIQLQGLVENALFERALRRDAERGHLERRPDIVAKLTSERERIAVERYLDREVVARIDRDSLGLKRFFAAHPADWALPLRVRLVRLTFDDRIAADRMVQRLRTRSEAESLEVRARRQGVDYVTDVTATSDPALFDAAFTVGADAVLGPDSTGGAWQVARVIAIVPGRPARLEEVRGQVEQRWIDEQGRRLLDALVARLRRSIPVTMNRKAIAAVD